MSVRKIMPPKKAIPIKCKVVSTNGEYMTAEMRELVAMVCVFEPTGECERSGVPLLWPVHESDEDSAADHGHPQTQGNAGDQLGRSGGSVAAKRSLVKRMVEAEGDEKNSHLHLEGVIQVVMVGIGREQQSAGALARGPGRSATRVTRRGPVAPVLPRAEVPNKRRKSSRAIDLKPGG